MRLLFLGTGTSFGVPQVGCSCSVCTSSDPSDRRLRSSVLIETQGRRLLIDAPPELRLALVRARVSDLDAVLFTHAHADHVHGIDDLRAISARRHQALEAWGPVETMRELEERFRYVFDGAAPARPGTTRPELTSRTLAPDQPAEVAGVEVLPFPLPHGPSEVFGYRVGPLAYITDAKDVPAATRARLRGVQVLVLNALLEEPHPLHLSIAEAVRVAEDVGARRTYLTHLTHNLSHQDLLARLPPGVQPAYDGLAVDVPEGPV
ncbi:MAG: MBL fold metallo-hydrolase [Gemmatimonadales bacterium]